MERNRDGIIENAATNPPEFWSIFFAKGNTLEKNSPPRKKDAMKNKPYVLWTRFRMRQVREKRHRGKNI